MYPRPSLALPVMFFLLMPQPCFGRQATGILEISAKTPHEDLLDAEITIDDEAQKQKTPATFTLPVGKHHIEVSYSLRKWAGDVEITASKPTKKVITLSERLPNSTYSLALAVGAGETVSTFPDDSSAGYAPAASFSLEARSIHSAFTLLIRGLYVPNEAFSGAAGSANAPVNFNETFSSYTLTVGPCFYISVARSQPKLAVSASPRDGENFVAFYLVPEWSFNLATYSTSYAGTSASVSRSVGSNTYGFETGLYGQSQHWLGRAALIGNYRQPTANSGQNADAMAAFMVEFGYLIGIGPVH